MPYRHPRESETKCRKRQVFLQEEVTAVEAFASCTDPANVDHRVETLVKDLIGPVADKWTMLVLEALVEKGNCASLA